MCVPCVRPELHRGLLCAKSCGGLRGFQGQVNPPPPSLPATDCTMQIRKNAPPCRRGCNLQLFNPFVTRKKVLRIS